MTSDALSADRLAREKERPWIRVNPRLDVDQRVHHLGPSVLTSILAQLESLQLQHGFILRAEVTPFNWVEDQNFTSVLIKSTHEPDGRKHGQVFTLSAMARVEYTLTPKKEVIDELFFASLDLPRNEKNYVEQ